MATVAASSSPRRSLSAAIPSDRLIVALLSAAALLIRLPHFGDPAFDVGFATTHLLSKANHLRALEDAFARAAAESWQAYRREVDATAFADAVESRAVRHTLACLLARVDGRSPLEYLDERARRRQRAAALSLMEAPPATMPALVTSWQAQLREQDVAD